VYHASDDNVYCDDRHYQWKTQIFKSPWNEIKPEPIDIKLDLGNYAGYIMHDTKIEAYIYKKTTNQK